MCKAPLCSLKPAISKSGSFFVPAYNLRVPQSWARNRTMLRNKQDQYLMNDFLNPLELVFFIFVSCLSWKHTHTRKLTLSNAISEDIFTNPLKCVRETANSVCLLEVVGKNGNGGPAFHCIGLCISWIFRRCVSKYFFFKVHYFCGLKGTKM